MKATAFWRSGAVLFAIVTFAGAAHAQEISVEHLKPAETTDHPDRDDEPSIIHITDKLVNSPEGQAALQSFYEAKELGLLPLGKTSADCQPGETRDFNVLRPVGENSSWVKRNFTLRASSGVACIWVDTELIGTISDDDISRFEEALLEKTPSASLRPDRGIIENNNYLFGDPPNVDGDGKTDILMYDIVESEGEGCCTLGFVTSQDLDLSAPANRGNKADILYVDMVEGFSGSVDRLAWVAAHEYQHLIHFNYENSGGREETFINEGLSEYASVANGYYNRGIQFQNFPQEHNTPLFEWREDAEFDYQRSGLFTTYIAQRIGPEGAGSIVRAREKADFGSDSVYVIGAKGYSIVLGRYGLTLDQIITDYHTALFLNDQSVDPDYGFAAAQRKNIHATATVDVDGRAASSSEFLEMEIYGGAVRYISFTDVSDLSLTADVFSGLHDVLKPDQRRRKRLRAIAERLDGTIEIHDFSPGEDTQFFEGSFAQFALQITDTRPAATAATPTKFDVTAAWGDGSGVQFERQVFTFDSGKIDDDTLFVILPEPRRLATRFDVPENAELVAVSVAPIYCNQFSNCSELGYDGSTSAPRDFRLYVWVDNQGLPGDVLYSAVVTDASSGTHLRFNTMEFDFFRIKMDTSSIAESLSGRIHVGYSNAGDDENYLVSALSERSGDDVSSFFFTNDEVPQGQWAPFDGLTLGGEAIFEGKVAPIRVEFLVPTGPVSSEDPHELPQVVTLSQNYPNPFNPTTSISYRLPGAGHVRLAVYDALGRHVETLVDGVQTAGTHEIMVNASSWSSGVYFYTLETDGQRRTRNMILLR